jgi:hypothetical protein
MAKFGLVRAAGYHMGFDKRRLQRFVSMGINKEAFHASKLSCFVAILSFRIFIHLHEKN